VRPRKTEGCEATEDGRREAPEDGRRRGHGGWNAARPRRHRQRRGRLGSSGTGRAGRVRLRAAWRTEAAPGAKQMTPPGSWGPRAASGKSLDWRRPGASRHRHRRSVAAYGQMEPGGRRNYQDRQISETPGKGRKRLEKAPKSPEIFRKLRNILLEASGAAERAIRRVRRTSGTQGRRIPDAPRGCRPVPRPVGTGAVPGVSGDEAGRRGGTARARQPRPPGEGATLSP
jgi:hypothetical protein